MTERTTIPEHQRLAPSAEGSASNDQGIATDRGGETTHATPGATGAHTPIRNAATDADSDHRRSGGSVNDPHGGHDLHGRELAMPEADPVEELVPGGQGAEAPPYGRERLTERLAETKSPEAGRVTDDVAPAAASGKAPGVASMDIPFAVDPVSGEGLRPEDMSDGTPGAAAVPYIHDRAAPETLAYTDTQKPNLPESVDPDLPRDAQGAGKGQEPVEGRDNTLVFDDKTGNFVIKDEEHGTGVTSQDFENP